MSPCKAAISRLGCQQWFQYRMVQRYPSGMNCSRKQHSMRILISMYWSLCSGSPPSDPFQTERMSGPAAMNCCSFQQMVARNIATMTCMMAHTRVRGLYAPRMSGHAHGEKNSEICTGSTKLHQCTFIQHSYNRHTRKGMLQARAAESRDSWLVHLKQGARENEEVNTDLFQELAWHLLTYALQTEASSTLIISINEIVINKAYFANTS